MAWTALTSEPASCRRASSLELERAHSGAGNGGGGRRHSPNMLACLAQLSPEGTARLVDVYRLSSNRMAQRAARRQCSGTRLTCNSSSTSGGSQEGHADTAPASPASTPQTPRSGPSGGGGGGAAASMLWKSGSLPQQQQHQAPLWLSSGGLPRLRAISLGLQPLPQPQTLDDGGGGAPPAAASPRHTHAGCSGCLTIGETEEARAFRPVAAGCGLAHGRASPLQPSPIGAMWGGNSWGGTSSGHDADAEACAWDLGLLPNSPSHRRYAPPVLPPSDTDSGRPVSDTAAGVLEPPGMYMPQRRSVDLRCRASVELLRTSDGGRWDVVRAGRAATSRRASSLYPHRHTAEEGQGGRVSPSGAGVSQLARLSLPTTHRALAFAESQPGALGWRPAGRLPGSRHAAGPLPNTWGNGGSSGGGGRGGCCDVPLEEEADSDGGEGGPVGRLLKRSDCCLVESQEQLAWVDDEALHGDDGGSSGNRGDAKEGVVVGWDEDGGQAIGAAKGVRPALSQTHLGALLERLRAARGAAKRAQ